MVRAALTMPPLTWMSPKLCYRQTKSRPEGLNEYSPASIKEAAMAEVSVRSESGIGATP